MIPQSIPTPPKAAADILIQAIDPTGPRPPATQVVKALLDTERAAKHPQSPLDSETFLGLWQLWFTASKKPAYKAGEPTGKGFYWPALAPGTLRFSRPTPDSPSSSPPDPASPGPDLLTIENQIRLGPLALRFSGPAKFLAKQNLLAFDFVRIQVFVGAVRLFQCPIKGRAGTEDWAATPIAKLPFFAFFAATDHYLAARGRGGGLALWAKGEVLDALRESKVK